MLRRSVLWFVVLMILPMTGLGCESVGENNVGKNKSSKLITQVLLKPTANVVLTTQQHLSPSYIQNLQQGLNEQAQFSVELQYVRPMSLGAHVFKVVPALPREQAIQASNILTNLDSVEYAEPDYPRSSR